MAELIRAQFSRAALTTGAIKSWGGNDYGELGNNTDTRSLVPVVVVGSGGGSSSVKPVRTRLSIRRKFRLKLAY